MNFEAIILTIKLALVVSIILVIIGIPIAYWVSFSRWRWKFLIEAVVAMPLILPPTVLGYYILIAISPNNPIGKLWVDIFGAPLPFSFPGLVIASVFYSLPFAVQPFATAFESVDYKLIEAALALGASRLKTFLTVIIPVSVKGIVTGIVLSFAHTVGEFGVVLMIGGNIQGVTRTVSIDIYDNVQAMKFSEAATTSFFLLIFSFLVLSIVYAINKRVWSAWPQKFW